jgi:hypothetical protein
VKITTDKRLMVEDTLNHQNGNSRNLELSEISMQSKNIRTTSSSEIQIIYL